MAQNEPALKKAMTTLEFLSQDRKARELYEMRQKALHDLSSMTEGARDEGKAEGKDGLICRFLAVRFGSEAARLQEMVWSIKDAELLDETAESLFLADTLEQAQKIIQDDRHQGSHGRNQRRLKRPPFPGVPDPR